jgi:8-oxo-dGTP diphosphatase
MQSNQGLKRAAVFCVLTSGDYYLLLKRYKEPHKGKYVPVGGKIDEFEAPKDAVVREVYEETGIEITEPKLFGTLVETSPIDYNWISYIYTKEIDMVPNMTSDEGILEWIHVSALESINTPPTDLMIFQYIRKGRIFAFEAKFDEHMNMVEMVDGFE